MGEMIFNPWPWYVAGPAIALIMLALLYFGESFGVSSNLRTICSVAGAHKVSDFFKVDVKSQIWNLVFVLGSILGGFIAFRFLTPEVAIDLSQSSIDSLVELGFSDPGKTYLPTEVFGSSSLTTSFGLGLLLVGGVLVGFGARYAGGCTSGHAISGLSNLQLPSLIAVVGFFIGGLTMVHLIFPFLFQNL